MEGGKSGSGKDEEEENESKKEDEPAVTDVPPFPAEDGPPAGIFF
jgi:hypothetical protein